MKTEDTIVVGAQMLVRRPAAVVFEAFIDPEITANFWFTKSTGRLEPGKTITWEWEMYGVSTNVLVKEIVPNEKIVTEWGSPATTVEYLFNAMTENTTHVIIRNYGFNLEGIDLILAIKDNTGGFTTVLDGLKAYLEHNIRLNLIADKFPQKNK
jgi:uncharacterized protein YndB with AHSA1/START domain